MNVRRGISIFLVCLLIPGPVPGGAVQAAAQGNDAGEPAEPVPYSPEEFAPSLLTLRRFEIIAFGVFPFAMFFSHFGYELYRFGSKSFEAGGPDMTYAPGLFSVGPGVPVSPEERTGIFVFSISISLLFATVDYLLGLRERRTDR